MTIVDGMLFRGEIIVVRGGWHSIVCKGNRAEIQKAKDNGNYDATFSSSPGLLFA